jgi:histidinol-phosphate aminotransferase
MPQDSGIERFIRPRFAGFGGYSAREAPESLEGELGVSYANFIKLDANENPYGCSPRVNRALANYPELNIYPDACQTELKKLLAGYTGATPERIVAGSGSGDLIDLLLRLLLEPGDEVITCVPAFSMFPSAPGCTAGGWWSCPVNQTGPLTWERSERP